LSRHGSADLFHSLFGSLLHFNVINEVLQCSSRFVTHHCSNLFQLILSATPRLHFF